jgi:hypothetical protein
VLADHDTTVLGVAGSQTAGVRRSAGVAVDSVVVVKSVEAFIAGTVNANGNVAVRAYSVQTVLSSSGTADTALVIGLAGAGGLHVFAVTTRASIAGTGIVTAHGSVQVAADDRTVARVIVGDDVAAVAASAGGAVAAVVLQKTVESFLANGARVTALGNRTASTPTPERLTAPTSPTPGTYRGSSQPVCSR